MSMKALCHPRCTIALGSSELGCCLELGWYNSVQMDRVCHIGQNLLIQLKSGARASLHGVNPNSGSVASYQRFCAKKNCLQEGVATFRVVSLQHLPLLLYQGGAQRGCQKLVCLPHRRTTPGRSGVPGSFRKRSHDCPVPLLNIAV